MVKDEFLSIGRMTDFTGALLAVYGQGLTANHGPRQAKYGRREGCFTIYMERLF
jgi:hypothetical protein